MSADERRAAMVAALLATLTPADRATVDRLVARVAREIVDVEAGAAPGGRP